jgi:hypothetical protein
MQRLNTLLLALTIALLILVFGLAHALNQHPPYAPQVHTEQQADSALKGEENPKGSQQQAAKANEEHGGKHTEQGENEGTEFWPPVLGVRLKITDSLLALFTGGLLIFTGLLWRSTDKLWAAGVRQAEVTQAALIGDQRGWIMVSVEIENLKFIETAESPGAPNAEADLRIHVENIGRTPALNATLHIALVGDDPNFTSITIRDFANEHQDCFTGRFVSPREIYTIERTVWGNGRELYQYGRRGEMQLLVIGCISYQILQDIDTPRQTGFGYYLARVGDDPRIFGYEGDLTVNDVKTIIATGGFVT